MEETDTRLMNWICPSCGLDHTPGDHDLALCLWQHDLARCDRELELLRNTHDAPAWLIAMGENDWQLEQILLLAEAYG